MDEVAIPLEVLEKAEASEMQSQAEFMSSGEYVNTFIRNLGSLQISTVVATTAMIFWCAQTNRGCVNVILRIRK